VAFHCGAGHSGIQVLVTKVPMASRPPFSVQTRIASNQRILTMKNRDITQGGNGEKKETIAVGILIPSWKDVKSTNQRRPPMSNACSNKYEKTLVSSGDWCLSSRGTWLMAICLLPAPALGCLRCGGL